MISRRMNTMRRLSEKRTERARQYKSEEEKL